MNRKMSIKVTKSLKMTPIIIKEHTRIGIVIVTQNQIKASSENKKLPKCLQEKDKERT